MTAPELARRLGMSAHPEGGWYVETWRSASTFVPPGYPGPRASATGILFLLAPGEQSTWHRVRSDELWCWHRGGPLTLSLGGSGDQPGASGAVQEIVLGPDVEVGQRPQALAPAGVWQAARPVDGEVLVSCVVSPGFDFGDFELLDQG